MISESHRTDFSLTLPCETSDTHINDTVQLVIPYENPVSMTGVGINRVELSHQVFQHFIQGVRRIEVQIRLDNLKAQRLVEGFGFKESDYVKFTADDPIMSGEVKYHYTLGQDHRRGLLK